MGRHQVGLPPPEATPKALIRPGNDRAATLVGRPDEPRDTLEGHDTFLGAIAAPVLLPEARVSLLDPLCQPWLVVVATIGLPSSAARSALRAACGDGGAEPSLR